MLEITFSTNFRTEYFFLKADGWWREKNLGHMNMILIKFLPLQNRHSNGTYASYGCREYI